MLSLCLALGCSNRTRTMDMYLDAVMLRELGQNELAIEKLKAVTEADPGFALAYSELGKAYQATGSNENAVSAFRTVVRLDPWSFDGYMNLAKTCEKLERFSEAAEAYARAAGLNADSLEAQVGAADCHLKAGQTVRALAHGEAARQIDEDARAVLLLLGRVYEAQKDYLLAIQAYRHLLATDAADVEAMLALGVAYMKNGQFDEAEKVLELAVRVQPAQAATYRHLGYCLVNQGQADRAIRAYEKALSIDANDWQAHRGLGVAYMVKANATNDASAEAQALRHWRQALEINPSQPKREALEKLIREHSGTMDPLQGLND
ncbi:MAG: tetratricopeptide repeat protein [Sedimentisphaerales bacterium]|nr:tetratricopeptide repeat protein [Sedimentisphaerales bacterium]